MTVTQLRSTWPERDFEEKMRVLPPDEQPWLVVFFGMLSYGIVAVCDTEEEANELLACWTISITLAKLNGRNFPLPGWTRHASPWDLQVRQQWDLDALTRAILDSYPTDRNVL